MVQSFINNQCHLSTACQGAQLSSPTSLGPQATQPLSRSSRSLRGTPVQHPQGCGVFAQSNPFRVQAPTRGLAG
jgi:hypothetical protein